METYSKSVCELKREFVKVYKGNSHTTEILPNLPNESLKIESQQLALLHKFLDANPIYSNHIFEYFVYNVRSA